MKNNESGFYLVIFPILLLVIISFIALAIDGALLQFDKISIQRNTDIATIVATNRIGELSNSELETLTKTVVSENYDINNLEYDKNNLNNSFTVTQTNNSIELQSKTKSETHFYGKVINGKSLHDLQVLAKGEKRPVAITLVADVSGSMVCPSSLSCEPYNQYNWVWSVTGQKCNNQFATGSSGICQPELTDNNKSRIESLKEAAKEFLGSFNPDIDLVSVVTYTNLNGIDKTQNIFPFQKNYSPTNLNNTIDSITAGGSTPLHSGILKGIDSINSIYNIQGINPDSYLKIMVIITDGVPNKVSPDPSQTPLSLDCIGALTLYPFSSNKMLPFIKSLVAAEQAKNNDIILYTIGVGSPDTNYNTPFQNISNNDLKSLFLKRLANDTQNVNNSKKPEFPFQCIPNYSQLSVSSTRGEYLQSPNGEDIENMLNRVKLSIQMRLIK